MANFHTSLNRALEASNMPVDTTTHAPTPGPSDKPTPKRNGHSCAVCGSSAPITRTSRDRTLDLCYYHEYVCAAHLLDPCPECDSK